MPTVSGAHVLVGRRILDDCRGMDAGLGGEGAFADIGRVAVRRTVEHLVELVGGVGEALELVVGDANLEFLGELGLQFQGRDDRDQIGVAAALAQPVERTLDLACAGAYSRERVRHRLLGVVVGVNTDMVAGNDLHHLAHDGFDLVRQRPAVCVAEHHPARALLVGGLGAGERVLRIGLVAVEKMLAVEQHFAALGFGGGDAVADRGKVLLLGGLERHPHVIVPGLGNEADGVGLGVEQRHQPRIVRGRATGPPSHTERRKGRVELALLGEQLGIGRIGARIAALDVIDAEIVEHFGDRELVAEGEIDAVGLRAVAQRGVKEIEPFAGHCGHQRR